VVYGIPLDEQIWDLVTSLRTDDIRFQAIVKNFYSRISISPRFLPLFTESTRNNSQPAEDTALEQMREQYLTFKMKNRSKEPNYCENTQIRQTDNISYVVHGNSNS
jgi:predicted helicase